MHQLAKPFLDNLWRWASGYAEKPISDKHMQDMKSMSPEEIIDEQMDRDFLEKMINRMLFGIYRYGRMRKKWYPPEYLEKVISGKMSKFRATLNLEYLVDIANYAMIGYAQGKAKGLKLVPTDDEQHLEYKEQA